MQRRTFLGTALAVTTASPLCASLLQQRWDDAADVFERATAGKQVESAVLHVVHKGESFTRHFGKAASGDALFLLGSISKPINVTAVMPLFDQGRFRLDDRAKKFLPDQLARNDELRKQHAPLKAFVAADSSSLQELPPSGG